MLVLAGNEGPQKFHCVGPENLRPGDGRWHQISFQHDYPLAAAREQVRQNCPSNAAADDESVVGHEGDFP